jgi:6-pyruvoyltetrahydropterin/6-carboxytetrahydropterin synthase
MSSHKVTITVRFEAMHRIPKHAGKCKFIHGHSYKAIVSLSAPNLDDMGMVIDFGVVKTRLKAWVDEKWDHNSVLHENDPLIKFGRKMKQDKLWKSEFEQFGGKEPYLLKCNPTAENMAEHLFNVVHEFMENELALIDGLAIDSVTIQETEDCSATFVPETGGGEGEGDTGDSEDDSDDSEKDDEEGGEDDEDSEEEEESPKEAGKKDGKPDPKARRYREI